MVTLLIVVVVFLAIKTTLSMVQKGTKKLPELPYQYAVLRFNKYMLANGESLKSMNTEPVAPIALYPGGIKIFPFYPWYKKPKVFYMGSKGYEFTIESVVTNKDKIVNTITTEVKWSIDPKRLFSFLKNCGEIEGDEATDKNFNAIENLLVNNITSAVRNLAASETEKPQTWQEALQAGDAFIEKIIASLDDNSTPSGKEVGRAKKGDLRCEIHSLGIIIEKINITKVTVNPKVSQIQEDIAVAKSRKEVEEAEREAETVEINHVNNMVKKTADSTGLSAKDAADLVQTERDKVRKVIYEGGARPIVMDDSKKKKGGK